MRSILSLWAAVMFQFLGDTTAQSGFGTPSCVERCGRKPTRMDTLLNRCSCDDDCKERDRCCPDYHLFCVKSCYGRCGSEFSQLILCQCNDGCVENCCDDYKAACVDNVTTTMATITEASISMERSLAFNPFENSRRIEEGYSYILGREIVCPLGVAFHDCGINPCDIPCPNHPDATCLVVECGGCKAKYVDIWGNEINCYDPEHYCPNGEIKYDCGTRDLCAYQLCPAFPRAICVPNDCGGCFYDFVDEKGNHVNCDDVAPKSPCAPGAELQTCTTDVCAVAICEANPAASCRRIFCGECRAEFYDSHGNVIDCDVPAAKPVCPRHLLCDKNTCDSAVCRAHPNAVCRTQSCGVCEPTFYLHGKKLRQIDCVIPNECIKTAKCKTDPCLMYACQARQGAICIAQFCNGCNALFFDEDGNPLTERDCRPTEIPPIPTCPSGKPRELCPEDLCLGARCGQFFPSSCIPDGCNGCKLIFFDERGNQMDCDDLLPPRLCPSGQPPSLCTQDLCLFARCGSRIPSSCVPDDCNDCELLFYDENGVQMKCTEKTTTTKPPTNSPVDEKDLCPSGQAPKLCDQTLCDTTACPEHPESFCGIDMCDDCKVLFFNDTGTILDCYKHDTTTEMSTTTNTMTTMVSNSGESSISKLCTSLNARLNCSMDECKSSTCAGHPNSICVPNPCDDCKPIFFDNAGKTVECSVESCSGKCGDYYSANQTCNCDYECVRRGDCCTDFNTTCETCKKSCGYYKPTQLCQCTSDCRRKRNCCSDFEETCVKNKSCKGKCNAGFQRRQPCQCHRNCTRRENCCPDYMDICM